MEISGGDRRVPHVPARVQAARGRQRRLPAHPAEQGTVLINGYGI